MSSGKEAIPVVESKTECNNWRHSSNVRWTPFDIRDTIIDWISLIRGELIVSSICKMKRQRPLSWVLFYGRKKRYTKDIRTEFISKKKRRAGSGWERGRGRARKSSTDHVQMSQSTLFPVHIQKISDTNVSNIIVYRYDTKTAATTK